MSQKCPLVWALKGRGSTEDFCLRSSYSEKILLSPSMCKALWGYKHEKLVAPLELSKEELDQELK